MKIAFLIDPEPTNEQTQVYKWVKSRIGNVVKAEIERITQTKLEGFNIIWWHYEKDLKLPELVKDESFKSILLDFINRGGNLLLTLSAIKLLNELQIEPIEPDFERVEFHEPATTVRKGFVSFFGHPIFKELPNGAITFSPSRSGKFLEIAYLNRNPEKLKIIAVEKNGEEVDYNKKILFEFENNGRIIAISSNVYFSQAENLFFFNLDRLILNSLLYLNNPKKFSAPKTYWNFTKEIRKVELKLENKSLRTTQKKLGKKDTGIYREVERNFSIHNKKIIANVSETGIENILIPPLQLVQELKLFLKKEDKLLSPKNTKILLKPESVVRSFEINSVKFQETIFAHPQKPILLLNYLIITSKDVEICLQIKVSPNILSTPNIPFKNFSFGFDEKLKCVCVSNNELFALIFGSSRKPSSVQLDIEEDDLVAKICYKIASGKEKSFNFAITGNVKRPGTAKDLIFLSKEFYKLALKFPHKIFKENFKDVEDKFRKRLIISTPDENLNNNFKLALAFITKFTKNIETLGKFLISDIKSHKVNVKEILSAIPALLKIGEYESVRDTLEFIGRFINLKGEIPSKFSFSGIFEYDEELKWDYIKACGDYLRCSKDKLFAKFTWTRLKKLIENEKIEDRIDVLDSLCLFTNVLKDEAWLGKLSKVEINKTGEINSQGEGIELGNINVDSLTSLSKFIQSAIGRYCDFSVNAFEKKLRFSPKIKNGLGFLKIRNLRLQNMGINITIERNSKCINIAFEKRDLPEVKVILEPEFERQVEIERILIDDKPTEKFLYVGGRLSLEFTFRFSRMVKIFLK